MQTISRSNPIEAWMYIFQEVLPASILIFAGNDDLLDFISAWPIVTSLVMTEKKHLFANSILVLPESKKQNIHILKDLALQLLEQSSLEESKKQEILRRINFIETPSFQSEELIELLEGVPNESAVGILYSNFYRFSDLKKDDFTATSSSWLGLRYRTGTAEELYFTELLEIINRVLPIARKKNLFVNLFCQFSDYFPEKLTQIIDSDEYEDVNAVQVSMAESQSKLVDQYIKLLESEKIEDVILKVEQNIESQENRLLLISYLYSTKNLFISAWKTIKPLVESLKASDNSPLQLSISNTALSAGDIRMATELLQRAIDTGLDRVEELYHAYLHAEKLNNLSLQEILLAQMTLSFPNHQLTTSLKYQKFTAQHQYKDALVLAQKLRYGFGIKMCQAFLSEPLKLSEFIEYGEKNNLLNQVLISSCSEAIRQNQLDLARKLTSRMKFDEDSVEDVIKLKLSLWGKIFLASHTLKDELVAELIPIIQYVAQNPERVEARFAIESFFEDHIGKSTSLIILTKVLLDQIHKTSSTLEREKINDLWQKQTLITSNSDQARETLFITFESFVRAYQQQTMVLGRGNIPESMKHLVTKEMIGDLVLLVEQAMESENLSDAELNYFLLPMLQLINLGCKHLEDPVTDFIALRTAVSGLAMHGFPQMARDLAETSFIAASNHSRNINWRYGQAWACYADSFERTGNPFSALIAVIMSLYAMDGEILSCHLLTTTYTLAARVLRDFGLHTYALEVIELEKSIHLAAKNSKRALLELDQLSLSIALFDNLKTADKNLMDEYLNRSNLLIENSLALGYDLRPILSTQAAIFRYMNIADLNISTAIRSKFESLIQDIPENQVYKLFWKSCLNPLSIKREQLVNALAIASQANHTDDLAHQLYPVSLMAEDAICAASLSKDVDFYLLAVNILSQPSFSIKNNFANETNFEISSQYSGNAKNWLLQTVRDSEQGESSSLKEAKEIADKFIPDIKAYLQQIIAVSAKNIQELLYADELFVILGMDTKENLCRLLISKNSIDGPDIVGNDIWSKLSFEKWHEKYPRGYGQWFPCPDYPSDENPSTIDVFNSISGLSIGKLPKTQSILIASTSNLAPFSFHLSEQNGKHLSEIYSISSIPSIPFFIKTREEKRIENRRIKTWLGSPQSEDLTIQILRSSLTPIFNEFDVEVVNDEIPNKLSDAGLAIVMSHGGTDFSGGFQLITDETRFYSYKDFARRIGRCGSAILIICNAGHNVQDRNSTETEGMAQELLSLGVRTVIAAPWSLNIHIPEFWLPPFLDRIISGVTFGEANFIANQKVKEQYSNPCAWAAMQLYGEPKLTYSYKNTL